MPAPDAYSEDGGIQRLDMALRRAFDERAEHEQQISALTIEIDVIYRQRELARYLLRESRAKIGEIEAQIVSRRRSLARDIAAAEAEAAQAG